MQQQSPPEALDLTAMVADLNSLLRLKTTVIGIKMFATKEEMTAIPKIRRPSAVHTTDQIVSMGSVGPSVLPARIWSARSAAPSSASRRRTTNGSPGKITSASGTAPPRTRASARKRSMWCRTASIRPWR
jgi:hypothetical protein